MQSLQSATTPRERTLTHSLLSYSPLHKTAKIALFLWCTILANGAAMYEICSFTLEISCVKSKILEPFKNTVLLKSSLPAI